MTWRIRAVACGISFRVKGGIECCLSNKKAAFWQTEVHQPGDICLLVLLVRGLFLFAVLTCPFFMYGSGD